jgi:hypothetical protein
MSKFIQINTPYRISEINLDRIATKQHKNKKKNSNKLLVKFFYKPNKNTHTEFLIQTPEILLKNDVKFNNKGYYELEAPFIGKHHEKINTFEKFIESLEEKVLEIIKKNKDWFSDSNIKYKSVVRFPSKSEEIYKLLRLKIDSNTVIKKNGKTIDVNALMKDYYVKCILRVAFIYIKGSMVTINIYPVVIDLRNKLENLEFASSESISSELTTDSESEEEVNEPKQEVKPVKEESEEELETLDEYKSSVLEIPSEVRDNCGTNEMFSDKNNVIDDKEKELNEEAKNEQVKNEDNENVVESETSETSEDKESLKKDSTDSLIEESDLNLDNLDNVNVNSESSIVSFNSDKYLETYGNVKIKEINLSEESEDSDYSEEINEDEITAFEQELLSKT